MVLKDIKNHNPLIAIPTGGGKTIIMGRFIYDFLEQYPFSNILVVSNTQEILEQNYEALCKFFPKINIGLFSAGLKSKSIEKITVAGINSIYKKPELFTNFHICVIDECHTIPPSPKSMYRQFIEKSKIPKYVGMSATIFRRGVGFIHKGKDAIFNKLSYDLTSTANFNRLIEEGYLCRLISKQADTLLDTNGVKITAGDFNTKQLSEKCDREEITKAAIKELIKIGTKNYKSWLVFAIDIKHAEHINQELKKHGYKSETLHTKKKINRKEIIRDFKSGKIQVLVSVGMVTTGFDAPNVDLIVLLRPTASPVLHVQMIGRGLRILNGKSHCLVLDFAGNIMRLGPINNVTIPTPKGKKKLNLPPPMKVCPDCGCHMATMAKVCDICGHKFKFKQKIKSQADDVDVIQVETKQTKWEQVHEIYYYIHKKVGSPDSLKVVYLTLEGSISEYICLDHSGYAQFIAKNWVKFRWKGEKSLIPKNIKELFKNHALLREPKEILIDVSSQYKKILDVNFS